MAGLSLGWIGVIAAIADPFFSPRFFFASFSSFCCLRGHRKKFFISQALAQFAVSPDDGRRLVLRGLSLQLDGSGQEYGALLQLR